MTSTSKHVQNWMDGQELKVHKGQKEVCFQEHEGLEMGDGKGIKAENLAGTRSWRVLKAVGRSAHKSSEKLHKGQGLATC